MLFLTVLSVLIWRAAAESPTLYTLWGPPQNALVNVIKWNHKMLNATSVVIIQGPSCNLWQHNFSDMPSIEIRCTSLPAVISKLYIHNSRNNREFELNCVARFFHIDSYCSLMKPDRIRFLDGDIVMLSNQMFPNLSDEEKKSDIIGGIHTGTYYLDISCEAIKLMVEYIKYAYSDRKIFQPIVQRYGRFYKPSDPKGRLFFGTPEFVAQRVQFSDMHMFRAFTHEKSTVTLHPFFRTMLNETAAYLSKPKSESGLTTFLVGNYGIYRHIVQIPRQHCLSRNFTSFDSLKTNESVALHFQGGCKPLISYFLKQHNTITSMTSSAQRSWS